MGKNKIFIYSILVLALAFSVSATSITDLLISIGQSKITGTGINSTGWNGMRIVRPGNASDIQEAYDTMPSGTTVYIPAGTYNLTSPIFINDTKQTKFVCDNSKNTHLIVSGYGAFNLSNNSYMHLENCHIYSMEDFENGVRMGIVGVENFESNKTIDFYIYNNLFENLTTAIRNKQSGENKGDFILIGNEFNNFRDVYNNEFTYSVVAWLGLKDNDSRILVENNYWHNLYKNQSKALHLNGQDNYSSHGVIVRSNRVYNVYSDGLYVHSFSNVVISNNEVFKYGLNNTEHRNGISSVRLKHATISNNVVKDGFGRPLRIDGLQESQIIGNEFEGGTNGYVSGITRFTENINVRFMYNQLYSYKNPAIRLENDSVNNTVMYNEFRGGNATITDLAEGTIVGFNEGRKGAENWIDNNGFMYMEGSSLVFNRDVFSLSKFRLNGSNWSDTPDVPSLVLNGAASDRPEICFIRGALNYCTLGLLMTANGGEFYSGSGTAAPTKTMSFLDDKIGINSSNPSVLLDVGGSTKITANGSGRALYIDSAATGVESLLVEGNIISGTSMVKLQNDANQTAGSVLEVIMEHAGSAADAATVRNDGLSSALKLDQNGNDFAFQIDSDGCSNAFCIMSGEVNSFENYMQMGNTGSNEGTFKFGRNANSGATAGPLIYVNQDNDADDQPALELKNDGSGVQLELTPAAQARTPTAGGIYYNSTDSRFYGCNATNCMKLAFDLT